MQQVQYELPQNCSQPVIEQQLLSDIEIENVDSQYDVNQQYTAYNGWFLLLYFSFYYQRFTVVGVPGTTKVLLKTPILDEANDDEGEMSNEDSEIVVDV